MAKAKQLKSSSPISKKSTLFFVALFAIVGGASLLVSHAAPHKNAPSNTIYGYKDVSSFFVNGAYAAPVSDSLGEDGSYILDPIQVANLNPGDSLTWGGKGADIAGPVINSTSFCYTLRATGATPVSVQFGNTPYTVKPSPVAGYDSNYWTYVCNASSDFKVLSGGSIHLYRVDILETLAY
jgi:hypothetical protein